MLTVVALWGAVLLPAGVGAVLCLAARPLRRGAPALAVGVGVVDLTAAVVVAVGRPSVAVPFVAGADFGLSVDGLAAVVLVAVAAVTLLVLLFAAGEIRDRTGRFFGLMLLFAAAVDVTVTASTLATLLVAWEVMGAVSCALIGFRWSRPETMAAGATAFLTTRVADLGLYAAAAAALAGGAGWSLVDLQATGGGWLHVAAGGVLVAALGKAAQLPFSFWLSRAMLGPSPVSALLHSAAMVAMGGYLLLRTAPLLAAAGWAASAAAWTGAITALLLGGVALAQRDLKQLLAASTAAQLGFVVLAAGVSATAAGAAQLVAHAAVKSLLFLVAGAWLAALGTRQLAALRGAGRRWPLVGSCAAVGALALAGVPPLSLWVTKDLVLAAVRPASTALYLTGLAGAVLSAAYSALVLKVLLARAPSGIEAQYDTERPGSRRVGLLEQIPLPVLAAAAVGLGLLAWTPVGSAVARAVGAPPGQGPGVGELAWSALLAIGTVIAVLSLRPRPAPGWARNWLGLGMATRRLVAVPVFGLAERLARFDDRIVAGGVQRTAAAGPAIADRLAWFDDRVLGPAVARGADTGVTLAADSLRVEAGVERAVAGLAGGVRGLGRWSRRSQTGQLYQYYAIAVLALVMLGAAVALAVGASADVPGSAG